jgi:hypothetical protein
MTFGELNAEVVAKLPRAAAWPITLTLLTHACVITTKYYEVVDARAAE